MIPNQRRNSKSTACERWPICRGAHTRVEFPELDKHFGAVNVICRRRADGMEVVEEPLPQMPDELRQIIDGTG